MFLSFLSSIFVVYTTAQQQHGSVQKKSFWYQLLKRVGEDVIKQLVMSRNFSFLALKTKVVTPKDLRS